jgi:hypothetical protein
LAAEAGTLDALLVPAARAVGAVASELAVDDGADLLARLGYVLPDGSDLPTLFSEVADDAGALADALADVLAAQAAGGWESPEFLGRLFALGDAVAATAAAIDRLATRAGQVWTGARDFLENGHVDELPQRLLDYLVAAYVGREHPRAAAAARVLGLVSESFVAAGPYNPDFHLVKVHWEHVPVWLTDPAAAFRAEYGWGTASFADELLLQRVQALLWQFGLPATLGVVVDDTAPLDGSARLTVPLFAGAVTSDGTLAGVAVGLRLERNENPSDADDVGLALGPYVEGEVIAKIELREPWSLVVGAGAGASGLHIVVRPSSGVQVIADAAVSGSVSLALRREAGESALVVLGTPEATRIELGELTLAFAATLTQDGADLGMELDLGDLALVVAAGESDGFLSAVLPAEPLRLSSSLVAGVSRNRGAFFDGGAGLQRTLQLNKTVGPLFVDDVELVIDAKPTGLTLAASATGGLALGPFAAVVRGVGLRASLALDQRGNLGGAELAIGFKPPSGVGLAINTPAVRGGGFLLLDYDAGRYAGVFELTIVGTVSVKAIAIIDTKLPGGRPGFALLIMITAEGFTPIQLGLGFTLTGIGGLLALNRTVDANAVRGGLRDGVLDSILFVRDPVRNATRVLATLDRVFPIAPDRLVIGPLAEIGWGTPPLVKLRIALLLEIPTPIRAVLLAALSVVLPREKNAVVELHVDAIGVLDLGRGELALDASLHHSRLLKFTLTGDMALRLNWGDEPTFVLSVGGFHPRFAPPRGLRSLNRLALTLSDSENPRVRLETYLAVTSNTIQMGARVTVFAKLGDFGVDGGGSFDALIQWSPFALDIAFAAWVRVFGPTGTLLAISVELNVTGPTPWHITGTAKVTVLFFSVSVGIDLTLGQAAAPQPVQTVDVATALWEQVSDPASWEAVEPAGGTSGVTLAPAQPAGGAGPLVVAPRALIGVRQRIVPLGTRISRVGGALPSEGPRTYQLDVTGPSGLTTEPLTDLFAPAQFTEQPDDTRLAGPAFRPMAAGIRMRPATSSTIGPRIDCEQAVETLDVSDLDLPASPGDPVMAVPA